ncbi:Zn(II)2Cys6 transcription factor [Aspergillus fischeri NRRL 181]|uniref:C6 finger domain protein, putative n=1 Tax=Neosartorya fischeri (strain ATCC 1020 / DSM 3700 / CBS 544.65 / FGSC A1164 / JCM 1740 / NRRL 181 / WB 181) TaxID=331117 RepID=A1DAP6_NEOFI|nr:C6 finger domain protein, putative [Aspergillus fischeri NRRL 181]EAW19936.1 C6 finger domain protein, putative [Aspergillus fischeri NRRL 181]
MVGVPRSTGCRTCIQRRIKCDEGRPECRRCRDRNVKCPGYQRRVKFYHQTPASLRNRKQKGSRHVAAPSVVHALVPQASMDGTVATGLASAATDTQMKEVFQYFVMVSFPGLFSAWRNRVQLNWLDFVRHHLDTSSQALIWSLRSLSVWHLGRAHKDQEKMLASRHLYGRGLQHLIYSLRNPHTATSNLTLMAAIHLSIYEMLDGLGEKSWLTHSRGIGKLFQLRGPQAHRDGFGRTLLVAYRPFLVADAFVSEQPCFLEEPGWRAIVHDTIAFERSDGKSCPLSEIVELAFNEIVLCPGLLVRTRAFVSQTGVKSEIQRESLVARITRCRDRLVEFHGEMQPLIVKYNKDNVIKCEEDAKSPIPTEFGKKVAKFAARGTRSAIAVLNQLLVLVEADKNRSFLDTKSHCPSTIWKLPAGSIAASETQEKQPIAYDAHEDDSPDRLDQLALSMGMLAIRS